MLHALTPLFMIVRGRERGRRCRGANALWRMAEEAEPAGDSIEHKHTATTHGKESAPRSLEFRLQRLGRPRVFGGRRHEAKESSPHGEKRRPGSGVEPTAKSRTGPSLLQHSLSFVHILSVPQCRSQTWRGTVTSRLRKEGTSSTCVVSTVKSAETKKFVDHPKRLPVVLSDCFNHF